MDLMATSPSETLYGLDLAEAEALTRELGVPKYRAAQLLEWLYQKHILTFSEARNLPKNFVSSLEKKGAVCSLVLKEIQGALAEESVKFLFQTGDGRLLESVLINQRDRRTVCVSTQLGCKMGCVFCASGKGKFLRNLSAGEIVEQVAQIARATKAPVTNVVFMGMGEPLDNFDATMKALDILMAPWGFGLGARRITVSTSGITPKMIEFVKRSEGRVRLSVSLHSANEKTRSELVPINKKYSLAQLRAVLHLIHRELKREITFEYTLIRGVNDSREEAEGVAKLARALDAKVNLIPYNPIREMDFKTPSAETIEKFCRVLENSGVRATVRQTAGREIHAACGQLRLDRENEKT